MLSSLFVSRGRPWIITTRAAVLMLGALCIHISPNALANTAPQPQSVSYFLGATPLADETVTLHAVKIHLPLDKVSWVTGVNSTVGSYDNRDDEAGYVGWYSIGPYWAFGHNNYGWFEFEFAPTYLDKDYIAGHNIGGQWHFTSSLSFLGPIPRTPFFVGVRLQHTSNGGRQEPNPGMDGVGVFFQFVW